MAENPYAYSSFLLGADFYLQKPREIVLVDGKNMTAMQEAVFRGFNTNRVVIYLPENHQNQILSTSVTEGKTAIGGKATAYVCHDFSCSEPVISPEKLAGFLK